MSLAPALLTRHAAQRLMEASLADRGLGGGGGRCRACVCAHGPGFQAKRNFVNAE